MKGVTAQNVIDNEILSNNNNDSDNNDEEDDNNNNDININDEEDDSFNVNDTAAKPIVHVSIEGTEINDKLRGGPGDDTISGEKGSDNLQGQEGDDEIDGGEGEDVVDGGAGKDELQGGKGADRFVCNTTDKIIDYNSLENDIIVGKCKYEDKGLIPKPIPDEGPLFPSSQIPSSQGNNFDSFASTNPVVPDSKESSFEKFISNFIDIDIPNLLR